MQAISAIDVPSAPVAHTGRSWARAAQDIRQGIGHRELWGHLGWQDIKQRYRRSVIGPLWITLSMAITAAGLGLLYSQLFEASIGTFLPYLTVGFIVWNFILGCLTEGSDTFIANEGLIKHLPAPLTVYALRTVWRQTLMLMHNLLVYVVVLAIFFNDLSTPGYEITEHGTPQPGLSWAALLAIPAFCLIALNGAWVTLLFGIISTRYRDIPQVVGALTQLLFFMTPIVWSTDILTKRFGEGAADWKILVAELNPLYHFIQILRAPLIGNTQSWHHWVVVGGITVIGWSLAFLAMRNYRARVSYWV
ncbi:galactan export ABC transporter permease subunit Wzm/RfbD [Actinokineospora iranica]|uniref:ABC-2 type transport system permease protein n=1 Tax=Actinokineospora iranica TaxID=1271860 RepID=A0A1G6P7Y4_9PSEU|nr:ABC transporter permease [Actinokineospora iranica]SDC76081.1 ABC-2 type transport system permease protein [Actinokineospora iranica]